jgi:hypothetical protein
MGWDFIAKCFALVVGVELMRLLFDHIQPPEPVALIVEGLYALVFLAFLVSSAISAFRILTEGRRHTAR